MLVQVLIGTTVGLLTTATVLGWLLVRAGRKLDESETVVRVITKQRDDALRKQVDLESEIKRLKGPNLRRVF